MGFRSLGHTPTGRARTWRSSPGRSSTARCRWRSCPWRAGPPTDPGCRAIRRAGPARTWSHGGVQVAAEARSLLATIRQRLHGRDTALIAAGLTFYAGVAVVPLLVLSLGLTTWMTSPATVQELTGRLAEVLPGRLGPPDALARLAQAGTGLGPVTALLTLLPISLYGEG